MAFGFPPFVLGIFGLAVIIALFWLRRDPRLDSINGPKGHPIFGIGLGFPPRAAHVFRKWAQEYGEIFKIRVGWYNWVVVNSPEAMREIFDKQVKLKQFTHTHTNLNGADFIDFLNSQHTLRPKLQRQSWMISL